jgi:uncharacterized PurR-regulated membrane protein YhhQ (DUF165 family)
LSNDKAEIDLFISDLQAPEASLMLRPIIAVAGSSHKDTALFSSLGFIIAALYNYLDGQQAHLVS